MEEVFRLTGFYEIANGKTVSILQNDLKIPNPFFYGAFLLANDLATHKDISEEIRGISRLPIMKPVNNGITLSRPRKEGRTEHFSSPNTRSVWNSRSCCPW